MFDRLTLRDQQSEMQWVHDYTLGFDGRVVNVVCDISKKNLAGDTTDLHGLFKINRTILDSRAKPPSTI